MSGTPQPDGYVHRPLNMNRGKNSSAALLLARPPFLPNQLDKSARQQGCLGHVLPLANHTDDGLLRTAPHRDYKHTTVNELIGKGAGNAWCRGCHHDSVIWGVL